MFEDSIFESAGTIETHSGDWMLATFLLNGAALLTLVLLPLIHPEALPQHGPSVLLAAPPASRMPPLQREHMGEGTSEMPHAVILDRPRIPTGIARPSEAPNTAIGPISMDEAGEVPNAETAIFRSQHVQVARAEMKELVHVSSGVMEGTAIYRTSPVYPAIAVAARVEGTVVLLATISKSGTIENLRVASGPAMLRQAAIDAVKAWRYRPYLLNGQPVEVETSVNVVFSLGR